MIVLLYVGLVGGFVSTQTFDGMFNNIHEPSWGSTGAPLVRVVPPAYSDGTYLPAGEGRPNARELSNALHRGEAGVPHPSGKTVFFAFFAEAVSHDLADTELVLSCPAEAVISVAIPEDDPLFTAEDGKELVMPLRRSAYKPPTGDSPNTPRLQTNDASSYLDCSFVYGRSPTVSNGLRSFTDGKLLLSEDGLPPDNIIELPMANFPVPTLPVEDAIPPQSELFAAGDPWANENPGLLVVIAIWVREHNRLCDELHRRHPLWTDQQLFDRARQLVIATYQHIVVNEFLPVVLGEDQPLPEYRGYQAAVEASASVVFSVASSRFWHTLLPSSLMRRDLSTSAGCHFLRPIRLCNAWFSARDELQSNGIEPILFGALAQTAEAEDNVFVEDVRSFWYGPREFTRRDLVAIDIQRGRDLGLPDFNTVRTFHNLPILRSFDDLSDGSLTPQLLSLYSRMSDMDVFVGGTLEATGHSPGSLFKESLRDQFARSRDGDRFFYLNHLNGLFTQAEVRAVENTLMADVVRRNVRQGNASMIGDSVFVNINPDYCAASAPADSEECAALQTYDWSSKSRYHSVVLTFSMVLWAGIVVCVQYACMKKRNSTFLRRIVEWSPEVTSLEEESSSLSAMDDTLSLSRTLALPPGRVRTTLREGEEMHGQYGVFVGSLDIFNLRRIVITNERVITLELINEEFYKKVLEIDLNDIDEVLLTWMWDGRVIIKSESVHDLDLRFPGLMSYNPLIECLLEVGAHRECGPLRSHRVYRVGRLHKIDDSDNAQLEAIRQHALAALGGTTLAAMDEKHVADFAKAAKKGETTLTLREFADVFNLDQRSRHCRRLFQLADTSSNGRVSVGEYLEFITLYDAGLSEDDTAREFAFQMFDTDDDGHLQFTELLSLLTADLKAKGLAVGRDDFRSTIEDVVQELLPDSDFHEGQIGFDGFEHLIAGVQRKLEEMGMHHKREEPKKSSRDELFIIKNESINKHWKRWSSFYQYEQKTIIWSVAFVLVVLGVFVERAYTYGWEKEHGGIRAVAGWGVAITRGAAQAQALCFSALLLTMSKVSITVLARWRVARWIPFEKALFFHELIGWTSLFFTGMHVLGHMSNFHLITTLTIEEQNCLFPEIFNHTHEYTTLIWFFIFRTLTGSTGLLLSLILVAMGVSALPCIRNPYFKGFMFVHYLYIPVYGLTIIHGTARLVQPPVFYLFFLPCGIIFIIDRLFRLRYAQEPLPIVEADLLPGRLLRVRFAAPHDFKYTAGDWAYISCPALGYEKHPFTLTSAPFERYLEMHIVAKGAFTTSLYKLVGLAKASGVPYPPVYMDGPFGDTVNEWSSFKHAVLVGSGVGVTPFAAVLKDLLHRFNTARDAGTTPVGMELKRVHFIWVARTQASFGWFMDLLRELEEKDSHNILRGHIFITSAKSALDLKTMLLLVGEHRRGERGQASLFTGLKMRTHFGRPDFQNLLTSLAQPHAKIGVFSCGSKKMRNEITDVCFDLSQRTTAEFEHMFNSNFG